MDKRTVLIVGESVFAEGISQTLAASELVTVVGTASSAKEAETLLKAKTLDVVIVTGTANDREAICSPLLAAQANLSIIQAEINGQWMRVITSQCVLARTADLLEAVAALPKLG